MYEVQNPEGTATVLYRLTQSPIMSNHSTSPPPNPCPIFTHSTLSLLLFPLSLWNQTSLWLQTLSGPVLICLANFQQVK